MSEWLEGYTKPLEEENARLKSIIKDQAEHIRLLTAVKDAGIDFSTERKKAVDALAKYARERNTKPT